tara:strand:+ start:852 stop:1667 length:816 start_codon:yes stop_codon:yes gene_type:complete
MPYNKTALKKMKKDDLVQLVLDIQEVGAVVRAVLTEPTATTAVLTSPTEEQLKDENERLKKHIIHNYQDLSPEGDGIPYTEYFPGGDYAIEDDGHRTPYSVLCGQTGEGIEGLQSEVDNLERQVKHDWNEIDKLKEQIQQLEDRNDELEDHYCEKIEELKEELDQYQSAAATLEYKGEEEEEDYDSENEEHSHKCSTCTKDAPSYQWQCDSCRPPYEPEEEGDSCCMGCDKRFCMYDAQKCEPEAYAKYFGSEEDDGDLCPTCIQVVKCWK